LGSLSGPEISNEAMMIAILLPSLAKAKELANRAVSAANESGIIRQCIAYSQRHGGNLPPNLAVLVADGYVTPRALVSPGSGLSPADITMPKPGNHLNLIAVAKQLAGHLSYSYFGQGVDLNDLTDPSELAVIFDVSELHHKHGCTVGFADGHVLWVPELQIPALVAQQNAYRQKHHLPLLP
jgi:prepilin-type processing-associated H-X9-DG protein